MGILQNFIDKVGPAVSAAFLNGLDILANGVFGGAQTVAQAVTALFGANPLPVLYGGTGAQDTADAINNLGIPAYLLTVLTPQFIGQIFYPFTAAEAYAGLNPATMSLIFPSGGGGGSRLNVLRFMTADQVAAALTFNSSVDHTAAIQAAINFLEGRASPNQGGGPHPGGTLYFPSGLYNISGNIRIGGHVIIDGDEYESTVLNVNSSTFTGTLFNLGPDLSGFFGFNGLYSFGSGIRNFRVSLDPQNQIAVVMTSVGAAQESFIHNVQIDGCNQVGINLTGPGGPANFDIRQVEIIGGNRDGLPLDREGFRISTGGGFVTMDLINVSGQSGHPFNIGIRSSSDSGAGSELLIRNVHMENVIDGYFPDVGGTNATTLIEGWSGSSNCTNLIHIPVGYTGTITAIAINGLTGSNSQPVAIRNENTTEAYVNFMSGIYSWSGNPGIQPGSFAASIVHNTPHIRYGKNAVQAISQNALNILTFSSKVDDWLATSEWNGSIYTAKVAGRYRVTVSLLLAAATWSAGNIFRLVILHNGLGFSSLEDDSAVGTFLRQLNFTDTVYCSVGDTISTGVFQGAQASINSDSSVSTCFITIDRE